MSSCYRGQASFLSVMRRSEAFEKLLRRVDPHITREEAFHLWVQRLLDLGQIQPASARQYLTYFSQSLKTPQAALRRALTGRLELFKKHEAKMSRVPEVSAIREAIPRGSVIQSVALALQLASGARWVDLERLQHFHVQLQRRDLRHDQFMVTWVKGKTDLAGMGQSQILPKSGPLSARFLKWFLAQPSIPPTRLVFQALDKQNYNQYLKEKLGVTTKYIRIASLNAVAGLEGEAAAKALGRHVEVLSTRHYTDRGTWGPAQVTARASKCLQ
ncbi:hypothetical protein DIPPA_24678 [Diplonema papillatum]|nr:hypothetical protein DIPPA_34096 [Diplonema papillatum]KAJ9442424.1 hypothetical protein DIPPA_22835 [Diplonema papillatum]KAJ9462603.1 hypothetical protein DIPPA_09386 [Diplonema papillatum]KAJ9462858.1 hypothetical protein DIPPA_24678 [Diplonema papillatum]